MRTPSFQDSQVSEVRSELRCWQGYAFAMHGPHRHDDIEVNLVAEAPLTYLFGGTPIEIRPGQIGLFWAAMPHRLIDCPENWRSYVSWLHLPLDLVLKWGLPEEPVAQLLRGVPIVSDVDGDPAGDGGQGRSGSGLPDGADFARWSGDLHGGSADLREVALLEIQAAIHRLAHAARDASPARVGSSTPDGSSAQDGQPIRADVSQAVRHAAAMARHAATHFRAPIGPADVAATVALHPNYAMTLFRTVVGMTLGAYLTQCRIADAQRLLITTGSTTTEIAAASGFGSQSAFYAAFTRTCGLSPGAYRRTYR